MNLQDYILMFGVLLFFAMMFRVVHEMCPEMFGKKK